jgi:hypothetical protein
MYIGLHVKYPLCVSGFNETVKYVHHPVLLAEEETLLQGMIDRVTEVGMEMNVESIR